VARGGGTLDLAFADGVKLPGQWHRTIHLFDWAGVAATGTFNLRSPYLWDQSALYTTGDVTLAAFPGDANADGLVNTTDFKALYQHYNKPGGQSEGDFNHDGVVTFADFQLLENWFGKSVTDAPVSVSAADAAALDAFASSAPEPPLLLPLAAALLLVRPRRHGLRDALLARTARAFG
jgi:hypothetical protein